MGKINKQLVFEWIMATLIGGSVIYSLWHLWEYSYLPQPFFYEPYDLYADWFNTAFWARDEGTYDVWSTLYPPLSFVFLQIFGLEHCYPELRAYDPSAGLAARDCDWLGLGSIWAFYLLGVVVSFLVLRRMDRKTAIPRTICVGLGWPMLDALERGNLMLVSYVCFVLAFTPLLKSARLKWLMAGLAVNFKVYLIAGIFPLLLKRRWRWVEGATISVIIVYLISFALFGRGTPAEIAENLISWSQLDTVSPLDLWFATTYKSLLSLMEGDAFPTSLLIGSRNVTILQVLLPALLMFVQAAIVLAATFAWLRPESVTPFRLVNLGIMLALITSESGGYTPAYFTMLVMMERFEGVGRRYAISMCYLLAISADVPIDQAAPVVRDTYYRDSTTIVTFYVTAGPFIRPLLIMSIPFAMACVTIREVWQDVRLQGWASRWRYRQDAPMLPFIRRPSPPTGA